MEEWPNLLEEVHDTWRGKEKDAWDMQVKRVSLALIQCERKNLSRLRTCASNPSTANYYYSSYQTNNIILSLTYIYFLILKPLISISISISISFVAKKRMGSETFVEVILAILLPPVGVFLRYGCGVEFWICLLLTVLGYIPGIIYALYVLVA